MQEFNIVSLLQKFSGEIIVSALISCLLVLLLKKIFKFSNKYFIMLSFLSGAIIDAVIEFFVNGGSFLIVANAITCGAVSISLNLLVKKFVFSEKEDVKKSLEKLLSSIVLSGQLDEVVDGILEKIAEQSVSTEDDLKNLIKENLDEEFDENELDNIVNFILTACKLNEKDKK